MLFTRLLGWQARLRTNESDWLRSCSTKVLKKAGNAAVRRLAFCDVRGTYAPVLFDVSGPRRLRGNGATPVVAHLGGSQVLVFGFFKEIAAETVPHRVLRPWIDTADG